MPESYCCGPARRAARFLTLALSWREAQVLRLRLGLMGEVLTLKEVAAVFRVSIERIGQIEKKAYRHMRWVGSPGRATSTYAPSEFGSKMRTCMHNVLMHAAHMPLGRDRKRITEAMGVEWDLMKERPPCLNG